MPVPARSPAAAGCRYVQEVARWIANGSARGQCLQRPVQIIGGLTLGRPAFGVVWLPLRFQRLMRAESRRDVPTDPRTRPPPLQRSDGYPNGLRRRG